MRGAECWTDHRLVRAKMELKIRPKAQHTTTRRAKKLEVSKFSLLPETKSIFQNALSSIELDGTNLWEDFKVTVLTAAQDTLGFRKRKCQDWFAENYEEIDAFIYIYIYIHVFEYVLSWLVGWVILCESQTDNYSLQLYITQKSNFNLFKHFTISDRSI